MLLRAGSRRTGLKAETEQKLLGDLRSDLLPGEPLALGDPPEGEDERGAEEGPCGDLGVYLPELSGGGGFREDGLQPLHRRVELLDDAELLLLPVQQAAVDHATP